MRLPNKRGHVGERQRRGQEGMCWGTQANTNWGCVVANAPLCSFLSRQTKRNNGIVPREPVKMVPRA